jgi:hypothetical protein
VRSCPPLTFGTPQGSEQVKPGAGDRANVESGRTPFAMAGSYKAHNAMHSRYARRKRSHQKSLVGHGSAVCHMRVQREDAVASTPTQHDVGGEL